MKNLTLLVSFLFSIFMYSCNAQTEESEATAQHEVVSVSEFEKKLNETEDPQLIDVRTAEEFDAGNIENSENWDYLSGDFERNISKLNKDEAVFVYCASGNRSGKASKKLKEEGYTKIYDLRGGYTAWQRK